MNPSEIDLQRSCRLCLKILSTEESRGVVSLFAEDEASDTFIIPCKIYDCLAIMVYRGDPFPSCVCVKCYNKLNEFDLFKQECTASDYRLKQHYEMLLQQGTVVQDKQDECPIVITPNCATVLHEPATLRTYTSILLAESVPKTATGPIETDIVNESIKANVQLSCDVPLPHADNILPTIKKEPIDDEVIVPDIEHEITNVDNRQSIIKLEPTLEEETPPFVEIELASTFILSIGKVEPIEGQELENRVNKTTNKYLVPCTATISTPMNDNISKTCTGIRPKLLSSLVSDSPTVLHHCPSSTRDEPSFIVSSDDVLTEDSLKVETPETDYDRDVENSDSLYVEYCDYDASYEPEIQLSKDSNGDTSDNDDSGDKGDNQVLDDSDDAESNSSDEAFSVVPLDENAPLAQVMSEYIIDFSDGIITYLNDRRLPLLMGCRVPNCKKKFQSDVALRRHLETHLDENHKSLTCCVCPKRFGDKLILREHEKSHFLNGENKCKLCGLHFETLHGLKGHCEKHEQVFHGMASNAGTGNECPLCYRKFQYPSSCANHVAQCRGPNATSKEKGLVFKCTLCSRTFRYLVPFTRHQQKCDGQNAELKAKDGVHKCQSCSRKFRYWVPFSRHKLRCEGPTTKMRREKCKECGEKMLRCELKGHFALRHPLRPVPCAHCPETFSHRGALMCHEAAAHPSTGRASEEQLKKLFRCDWCTSHFYRLAELSSHVQREHCHFETGLSLKPPGIFACGLCSKAFADQPELEVHENREHNTCGQTAGNAVSPLMFSCTQCGMVFPQKGALICHQAFYHREEVNKNINTDPGYFRTNYATRKRHTDQTPVIFCDLCGMTFNHKRDLSSHHVSFHQEKLIFPCNQCEMAFQHKGELICHQASHRQEDVNRLLRATCDLCGMTFNHKRDLFSHQVSFHQEKLIFPCNQCEMAFQHKGALICHQASHRQEDVNRLIRAKPN